LPRRAVASSANASLLAVGSLSPPNRLEEHGREKLLGLLRAGDPEGGVTTAVHAKEAVRELDAHLNAALALE